MMQFKPCFTVCSVPLFAQLPVLLLIRCIQSEQRLQMASVRFHILVINVDVVQLLLLLENLLRGALTVMETGLTRKGPFA